MGWLVGLAVLGWFHSWDRICLSPGLFRRIWDRDSADAGAACGAALLIHVCGMRPCMRRVPPEPPPLPAIPAELEGLHAVHLAGWVLTSFSLKVAFTVLWGCVDAFKGRSVNSCLRV
jgi:hypothetical protein